MRERPPKLRDAARCDRVASAVERATSGRQSGRADAIWTRTALLCVLAVATSACTEDTPPPTKSKESIGVVRSALLLRKQFTIPAAKVTSDLTNFPVLVRIASDANLAAFALSSGLDLRFTSDAAGSTLLKFEIESWTPGTGALVAWVRLPTVAAASSTTFYLQYGDGDANDRSDVTTSGTFSAFKAVWHMDSGGGSASVADSSGNANTIAPDTGGTSTCNTVPNSQPSDTSSGNQLIGKALTFGANTCNRLVGPNNSSTQIGNTSITTISAWMRSTGNATAGYQTIFSKRTRATTATTDYELSLDTSVTPKEMVAWTGGAVLVGAAATEPTLNAWSHIALTYDSSSTSTNSDCYFYKNGVLVHTITNNADCQINNSAANLWIGGFDDATTDQTARGDLDEVRLSASRSAVWLKAEYDNQVSGSTFYSLGHGPTMTNVADQSILFNTTTGALAFTVGDLDTAVGSLTVTATSNNTTLIPNANVVLGGTNPSRTVTMTPATGQTGTAVITITVSDGVLTAIDTVTVTVNLNANGTACTAGSQCSSASCVDGVCCNTSCGGGVTTDCVACSTAAGAAVNGTCGPASTATVCRGTTSSCDFAETCPAPAYWKTLTFDGAQVSATLTNYTVLVRITDAGLMAHAASNGSDIYFASTSTGPALDYEIERYDSSTGSLVAWVRIPSLATSSDTTIYMLYGAGGADQSDATGTWDSSSYYVWHLAEDPGPGSAGDIIDSTNRANGTAVGTMTPADLVDGVAGKGIDFNGTSDQISFTNTFTGTGSSTISAWINQATDSDGVSDVAIVFGDLTMNNARFLYSQATGTNALQVGFWGNDKDTAYSIENAGWKHVVWTWNGSTSVVYVNGVSVYSAAHASANTTGSAGVIGNMVTRFMRGQLDEIRVDTGVRPLAWITTQYNNQRVGSTFIKTIGAETMPGCPADTVATAGTVCRATVGTCDAVEVCNGTTGTCPTDAFSSSATLCRGTAGECDLLENCTGTSNACPADVKKTSGTACSTDGNPCTLDQCNGTSAVCSGPPGNAGALCRASAGVCDVVENCTGTSSACPTDLFVSAATACRGTTGECDLGETCTGSAAACPADAKKTTGTACTSDSNPCSLDQCDGSAVACQHPAGNAGTLCNATTGVCDVAETCTGTSTSCPANVYAATSVVCRATVGECDAAENCTGVSAACPGTDAKLASGSACSSDGVTCTADQCDGSSNTCQHPAGNAGTQCRGTGGACDAAENCTGTSTACPADILTAGGVVCRATAGTCDFAETCTGTSNACPSDSVQSSAVVCRASAGFCDVAPENCTGTSSACPADSYKSSATTCRATAGVCDVVEMCTGSTAACPSDTMSTAVCRGTAGVCDAVETCTGTSVSCPADIVASSSTPCRYQSNVCDAVDFCTGASGTCPADAYAPVGTDCGYATGAVTIYSTGGAPGNVALLTSGPYTASVTNAGPNSSWSDALRYATTLTTTGANQYLYQQISTTARKFQAYDFVEYDVYLADPQAQIGGIDIENGGTALRGSGILDQNSVGSHPATNIVSNAYGAWYHRRYAMGGTGMVNTTSTNWTIADENDTAHGAYTAYYDNIIVAETAGECTGANVCKIAAGYGCTANSDCGSNVCNSTTLDASNVHRWNFDTNLTATIGGQNGTAVGTVTHSGGAAVLTGGGTSGPYITLPTAVMSSLTSVTFEAWFSLDTHVTWQRIFDFGNDTTEYIFLADRFDTTNIPRVAYKRDNGTEITINATTAFPLTTLTHVALSVAGGSSMTLYINGTLAGSAALGASDTLAAITFDQNYLGQSQYTTDTDLDGNIYDFRIYNKALSATEVLATYRKGVDSKVCIAQYPLGVPCASGGECLSTFCVDGRCCNNACDASDTTNCQGCSTAVGAAANGTCGPIANGTVCRASIDGTPVGGPTVPTTSCDLPETCNGVATTCPADTQ